MSAAAATETRVVRAGGVELYGESSGQGDPIVLVHGLGASTEEWRPQVEHFSRRYRVVAIDLRGHGRSSKPRDGYSIGQFARDLAEAMRALQTGPAHVVGISLGGMVAFQLVVDAPELVRSLTIVNSGPAVPAQTFKQRLPLYVRLAYLHLLGLRRMAVKLAGRLFPKPEHAELARRFVERLAGNDKRVYLASLKAIFAGWSVAAHLPSIRCPVLVLAADQDYTPVELKRAYAARLPDARVVVVPDARHALPMEKPAEFNAALEAFLAPLAAGPIDAPAAAPAGAPPARAIH